MNVLYISGSPRPKSNTELLFSKMMAITGGEMIKLADLDIGPCRSCWACRKVGRCVLDDDMSRLLTPKLLAADAVVLGSPVFFNNVSAQLKAFIDRTWALRGQLTDKVGGAVVVGRRYGAEGAITAINTTFLKHQMIPANRGVCGLAFASGEIEQDAESLAAADRLAERVVHLLARMGPYE